MGQHSKYSFEMEEKCPPFTVISVAADSDARAIEEILKAL